MKPNSSNRLLAAGLAAGLAASLSIVILGSCSGATGYPAREPPAASPTSEPEAPLQAILATTDIGTGRNRLAFLLLTPQALVTVPEVAIAAYRLETGGALPAEPTAITTAGFHPWPFGTRGSYVTELDFTVGRWLIEASVADTANGDLSVRIPVVIDAETLTPSIGAGAPPTSNKTVGTVENPSQLSTGSTTDPALYQLTVDEAVANGRPTLLVFASPALCTSPTCGPQVETVSQLAAELGAVANFIHIEVYDNPDEIQGDLSRARYAQAVKDWGLSKIEGYLNESWVFILEPGGRIAGRFEGYASAAELDEALKAVLSA